jgi:ribonuclease HII
MYHGQDNLFIGADEVGLGSIAGPLVVCAALCTEVQNKECIRCNDSKKYHANDTKMQRDIAASRFITYKIIEVSADDLCRWGYSAALGYAFRLAIETVRYAARPRCPIAILDGDKGHRVRFCKTYVSADKNWPVVSLASCLAKCRQLQRMRELHARFPEYGFDNNAGYGTKKHTDAIIQHGALAHHHRIPVIAKMKGMQSLKTRNAP